MDKGEDKKQPNDEQKASDAACHVMADTSLTHQEGPDMKKRRIQMDDQQCLAHSRTEMGALPLTSPNVIKTSSKDVNRGLYPRQPRPKLNNSQMQTLAYGDTAHASSSNTFSMPKAHSGARGAKRNLMKDTDGKIDRFFCKKETAATPSKPASCNKDSNSITNHASTSIAGCSSAAVESDSLLDDFEQDTAFETAEVLDLVEKAESESDTSSPCKSVGWGSPFKNVPDAPSTSTYGLLGDPIVVSSDDEDGDKINMFSRLPDEILENIFCNMPMLDLSLSVNLVCKSWNRIINRKKFLSWKKKYHKYKVREDTTCAKLYSFIVAHQMGSKGSFLLQIISYVKNFRNWFGASMVDNLKQHHNYEFAKDLIEKRAPELVKDGVPNPWCLIAALAILAETVADVTLIIKCLLNPMATCTAVDVTECLYCVATLLLMLQRRHNINRGLHYRVFYALYLYENSFSDVATTPSKANKQKSTGQQSLWRYGQNTGGCVHLTHEQMRIVTYDPKPNEVIKIVAFAGTGKTTTLVRYAQRRPHMKFLYVAFNRTVKEHAEKVFPFNVTARTTHSLAMKKVGFLYNKRLSSNLMPKNVNEILPKEDPRNKTGLHWISRAKLVIETLKAFMCSREDYITTLHVPTSYTKNVDNRRATLELDHRVRMKLADDATLAWKLLTNVKRKERITHDMYLKLYQLRKPKIYDYNCILIDEAQDLTPVQQDILLRQPCAKIMVGDPNQQIYSFRGAENAMDQIQRHVGENVDIKTFHLTQSFRFGPEIAYVSNLLLEFFKKNTTQFIVGTGKQGGIHGDEVGTTAIICRSNGVLFDQAVRICDEARKEKKSTSIGFAGGIEGYQLDMILDIFLLFLKLEDRKGRKIKNGFIRAFGSFYDLKNYAINAMDGELEGKIKIVQKYNIRIPALIEDMKHRATKRLQYADIILSTAHKAKGLEFDTVKLTEDFALEAFLLSANGQVQVNIQPDELNLIYVAVTRAKKRLVLNYHLKKFLEYAIETFECPVYTKSVLAKQDEVPHCLECMELIDDKKDSPLITKRPKIQICFRPPSTEVSHRNGYLCARCSADCCPWLSELCGQDNPEDTENAMMREGDDYDMNDYEFDNVDFEDSDEEGGIEEEVEPEEGGEAPTEDAGKDKEEEEGRKKIKKKLVMVGNADEA